MEWIQRNPKKAVALSALAVLVVVIIVWGASSRSDTPTAASTLGLPSPALPTTTPTRTLTALPTPSPSPAASGADASTLGQLDHLMAGGKANVSKGFSHSLEPHQVVIEAGAEGGLAALAWRIPHAKGATEGEMTNPGKSWSLTKTEFGLPAYTGFYTYVAEARGQLWCTIKVDGKVVDHQEARGPWGQVYCGI